MTHVAVEQLADCALGEPHPLSPIDYEHLLRCAGCTATVDELSVILTVSTDPASPAYAAPVDPKVWLAVKARLAVVKQLPKRESAASLSEDGRFAALPIIS